jgi:hypothetical protein
MSFPFIFLVMRGMSSKQLIMPRFANGIQGNGASVVAGGIQSKGRIDFADGIQRKGSASRNFA